MSLGWMHAPLPECAGQPHPGLRGSGQGESSPTWSEEISLVSSENVAPCLLRAECLKMCGRSQEQFSHKWLRSLRAFFLRHGGGQRGCARNCAPWKPETKVYGEMILWNSRNNWVTWLLSWLLQGPTSVNCSHILCFQKGTFSAVGRAGQFDNHFCTVWVCFPSRPPPASLGQSSWPV